MTFLDFQPIDPYEARLKVIATLLLLSELGAVRYREVHLAKARVSDRARSFPSERTAHGGSRLVRPPRSC